MVRIEHGRKPQLARAKTIQERLNSQKVLGSFEFAAFFLITVYARLGQMYTKTNENT